MHFGANSTLNMYFHGVKSTAHPPIMGTLGQGTDFIEKRPNTEVINIYLHSCQHFVSCWMSNSGLKQKLHLSSKLALENVMFVHHVFFSYQVVTKWPPSNYQVVTNWKPSGHQVVHSQWWQKRFYQRSSSQAKWSPCGHHVVTKWSPSGCHLGTLPHHLGTLPDQLGTLPDHLDT